MPNAGDTKNNKNIVLSLEDFAVWWRRHMGEQNYYEKYRIKLLTRNKETWYENSEKWAT